MDDLISRQAVVNKCGDWYVDEGIESGFIGSVNQMLDMFPAADVAPVVRCRDCKHWDNGNLSFECPWDYGRHGSSDEDDFCSYGERREE